MSDPTVIYHGSPKQLVTITPTAAGVPVTSGYTVQILPLSIDPTATDTAWQAPDADGAASGIFVGSATTAAKTFPEGTVAMPYAKIVTANQTVIVPCPPVVLFN